MIGFFLALERLFISAKSGEHFAPCGDALGVREEPSLRVANDYMSPSPLGPFPHITVLSAVCGSSDPTHAREPLFLPAFSRSHG